MARRELPTVSAVDPRARGIDLGEWLGLTSGTASTALGARHLMEGEKRSDRIPLIGGLSSTIADQFAFPLSEPGYSRLIFEEGVTRIPSSIGEALDLPWPYNTKWVWVLSGGGEKGAFQLGASLYLMEKGGIPPQGIAASSVGSVNALALAEFYYSGVEKLRDLWLGLSERSDMYAWAPWVEDVNRVLRPHGLDIRKLLSAIPIAGLSTELSLPPTERMLGLGGFEEGLYTFFSETPVLATITSVLAAGIPAVLLLSFLNSGAEDLKNAMSSAMRIIQNQSDGLFTFDPLRRLMERFLQVHRMFIPIRFVAVGAGDGRVYHALSDLDRPHGARVIMAEEHPEGGLIYSELGTLAIAEPRHRLIQAALASAAIPFVNPPVDWPISIGIEGETYKTDTKAFVDGGVREVLPIEAGLEMFNDELANLPDPRGIIAISVSAPFVDPDDLVPIVKPDLNPLPPVESNAAADFNIFDMASLGFSHATDEVVNNELRFALENIPDDIDHILVAPSISMSSPNKLDPGMTQLLLAYGYMTVFDQITRRLLNLNYEEYRERLWRSTNEIMQARYLCWRIERDGSSAFHWDTSGEILSFQNYLGDPMDWWGWLVRSNLPETFNSLSRDFDWLLSNHRLERQLGDLRPSLRELKRHIHEWVDIRVRAWGLESIPDVYDLSNFEVGNENHPVDWWRRFERHGIDPDTSMPTGPGSIINSTPVLEGVPEDRFVQSPRFRISFAQFDRPETSPWAAAFTWEGEHHNSFVRSISAASPPSSSFERSPDYCVVRLEGYILANDFELPVGTEAVELFSMWSTNLTDHWTGSAERGRYPEASGYGNREILGRIFDPERKPSDTIRLVTWYSPSRNDHLTTSDFRFTFDPWEEARRRIPPDYQFQRIIGYLYSPYLPQSELRRRFRGAVLPLWTWYSPSRKDFFTTTDSNWSPDFFNVRDEITIARRLR